MWHSESGGCGFATRCTDHLRHSGAGTVHKRANGGRFAAHRFAKARWYEHRSRDTTSHSHHFGSDAAGRCSYPARVLIRRCTRGWSCSHSRMVHSLTDTSTRNHAQHANVSGGCWRRREFEHVLGHDAENQLREHIAHLVR